MILIHNSGTSGSLEINQIILYAYHFKTCMIYLIELCDENKMMHSIFIRMLYIGNSDFTACFLMKYFKT